MDLLYKYRGWANDWDKDCLRKCEFFAASPDKLNDPYDCKVGYDFSLLDTEEKQESFFKNQIFRFAPNQDPMIYQKQLSQFKQVYKTGDFADKFNIHTIKLTARAHGVFSLSAKWDEVLLWSHYANNHKGFCVGLDLEKMKQSQQFDMFRRVEYLSELPHIGPNDDLLVALEKRLFTKSLNWQYEHEFRFVKSWIQQGDFPEQARKVVFGPDVIKEVILGVSISIEDETEIKALCKESGWALFKVAKSTGHSYSLDRYNIHDY